MFESLLKKKMPDYSQKKLKPHIRFSVRHPILIGHYNVKETLRNGTQKVVEHRKKLRSIQEVADFICDKGTHNGNLVITTADNVPFIETFGIYLNRIEDAAYRAKLLEVLIPMQMKLDESHFE